MVFFEWTGTFLTNLELLLDDLHFPVDVYECLKALYGVFSVKYQLAITPTTRTKVAVQDKNDARRTLEQAMQQCVREYLSYNHSLSNDVRKRLGLPVPKASRTPAPVAATSPFCSVDSGLLGHLRIAFRDPAHKGKARPHGQRGVVVQWAVGDEPPDSLTAFPHTTFVARSPATLEFPYGDRGKTVYFCLCWENTRGERGPWSLVASAIIP
ncbi:MAG: hypothetical protein LBF90_02080 [Prevotellaceae bacterium]|nr:hypothetical protein [Prevotellaceae bacterium]